MLKRQLAAVRKESPNGRCPARAIQAFLPMSPRQDGQTLIDSGHSMSARRRFEAGRDQGLIDRFGHDVMNHQACFGVGLPLRSAEVIDDEQLDPVFRYRERQRLAKSNLGPRAEVPQRFHVGVPGRRWCGRQADIENGRFDLFCQRCRLKVQNNRNFGNSGRKFFRHR